MQTSWFISGLVIATFLVLGISTAEKISGHPHREKRQNFVQFLTVPNYQKQTVSNVVNLTRPLQVQLPVTKYIVQQPGQFPFAFPFNWPFSLIPGVVNFPSNTLFNISQVSEAPQPIITTPTPTEISNDLDDFDPRKEAYSCGKASVYREATTRIVNGDTVQYGEFPFLVAVMRDNGRTHLCGGSLVSSRYVLSAAHCYAGYKQSDVSKLRVLVGDYNIYDSTDVKNQVRSVTRLITHRFWSNPIANLNDVALLKLDSPVTFNNYVQPVCLPKQGATEASFYSSGTVATVAGWGKVQWGYPEVQRTPLKIAIPLVDKNTCQNSIGLSHTISDSMICAGAGYKSACLGDSGGPLLLNQGGRWYQIGIVSWGINCNGYGVFTRVSSFAGWLDKHMKN